MNDNANNAGSAQSGVQQLPPWAECELFCINSYSGASGPACGWRGTFQDVRRDTTIIKLLCPRCGCPTLLRIPLDRSDEAGAQSA